MRTVNGANFERRERRTANSQLRTANRLIAEAQGAQRLATDRLWRFPPKVLWEWSRTGRQHASAPLRLCASAIKQFAVLRCSRKLETAAPLACAEQAIAGITEAGQDVAVLIEFAVEAGGEDVDIGMFARQSCDAFRCRDEAQKTNALCAGALE